MISLVPDPATQIIELTDEDFEALEQLAGAIVPSNVDTIDTSELEEEAVATEAELEVE